MSDTGAKIIAEWLGYAWDGLDKRSVKDRPGGPWPEWAFDGAGYKHLQAGQPDLSAIADRIAAAEVAAEREACARVARGFAAAQAMRDIGMDRDVAATAKVADVIATTIRARGPTTALAEAVEAMRAKCEAIARAQQASDLNYASRYPDEARKMEDRAHRAWTIADAIAALKEPKG